MRCAVIATIALAGSLALAAGADAVTFVPLPQISTHPGVARFTGSPDTPHGVYAPRPPQNPFLAHNPHNNVHDDAYMSDTYPGAGPLGNDISVNSIFTVEECGSLTWDSHGRIVAVCVGIPRPTLRLLNPDTLEEYAEFALPPRPVNSNLPGFLTDFSGGGYFYLDNRDRATVPTLTKHIYVIAEAEGPGFTRARDYDLSGVVAGDDKIVSTIPDWSGRIWFITAHGVVGTIDPRTGKVATHPLREEIANSFATDETGGVFVVTTKALYRLDPAPDGTPQVTWREVYRNVGIQKPGQVSAGSGTTPTLQGDRWVSITDNADPMNVVVYRREKDFRGARKVCEVPVFDKGASDTENSLIGAGRAMIVTNNYGYRGPVQTSGGAVTTPGIERVDINRDGRGCHKIWHSDERSPSAVPKLSLANGLLYTIGMDATPDRSDNVWYLTALDFRTGKTVFRRVAGFGSDYNVNYSPVILGPDGAAYYGTFGGLVRLADRTPPHVAVPRPQLSLRVRVSRRGRVTALVTGADAEWVRRVRYRVLRLSGGRVRVTAAATMLDGARYTLRKTVRRS